jgi:alpha-mannosidase
MAFSLQEFLVSDQEIELLIVPHTHWDREWYLTYQQFRMKLVDTLDLVLDILDSDPDFSYFMLDGQTIVLEDYLEIRPENAARLKAHASKGRLLVGPWYLQPDEFLVGGESLIRNLQQGRRISEGYGGAMPVGYVPDTFGHVAQLPQLLRGFGIDNAVFWRGVGPEIKHDSFRWRAADGSEVLAAWLRDDLGYSNAAVLPTDAEALAARVRVIASRMQPWANGRTTLLLMNGSDHLMPQPELPAALAQANARLQDSHLHLRIGTLPHYIAALRQAASTSEEQSYSGELRSSYRAHLLPGVYSSRMWLKQQNASGEALLTRWAEPATCWAWLLGSSYPRVELDLAWKFLMQNHPHDSICGCSIDQVHSEMMPRFAQSRQIAEELTVRALESLANKVDTLGLEGGIPLVVFNPAGGPRSEVVRAKARIGLSHFQVVDENAESLPYQVLSQQGSQLLDQVADKAIVMSMLGMISEGRALGYSILDAHVGHLEGDGAVPVELVVSEHGTPDLSLVESTVARIRELAEDESVLAFHVIAQEAATTEFLFAARDVPSYGGRTFFLRHQLGSEASEEQLWAGTTWLENEYLRVEADAVTGTVLVRDKVTGAVFPGLNQFVDGGDVGDLYTYCPPAHDTLVDAPAEPGTTQLLEAGPARATLRLSQTYRLPAACSQDRAGRSPERATCEIVTDVSLGVGSRRVEFETKVANAAKDHRLRVLFPVPFSCDVVAAEGAFEVTRRPVDYRMEDKKDADSVTEQSWSDWAETPVNTQPQRRFADLSDGERGLAVLNHGLPEYEVIQTHGGSAFALTLLRAVEWLSRNDLPTRRGHAGPPIFTPEAQGQGSRIFEYAIVPHMGDWESNDGFVLQAASAYEAPMRAVVTNRHAGKPLPSTWSFLQVTPSWLVVSAVKRSIAGDALILRLTNPLTQPVSAEITLAAPFEDVEIVDLSEQAQTGTPEAPMARILSTGVRTTLRGGEIQTLRFSYGAKQEP